MPLAWEGILMLREREDLGTTLFTFFIYPTWVSLSGQDAWARETLCNSEKELLGRWEHSLVVTQGVNESNECIVWSTRQLREALVKRRQLGL